jgi:hypothetical protein
MLCERPVASDAFRSIAIGVIAVASSFVRASRNEPGLEPIT